MQSNIFIRSAIAKTLFNGSIKNAEGYIEKRWGITSGVTRYAKALQNPISTDAESAGALAAEKLSRSEFVEAVISASILGQLQGLIKVPALTKINIETTPIVAPFVGQYQPIPAYQGTFGATLINTRKVGIVAVLSSELLLATGDAAEGVISGQIQRALVRGIDAALVGAQARDAVSPAGLSSMTQKIPSILTKNASGEDIVDIKATFDAAVLAFTGDLTKASLLVNPLTAVGLRSPSEQAITAKGGVYGGLPAIASYGVPIGKLFIVDGTRVLAYIGDAEVDVSDGGDLVVDDGTGTRTTMNASLFQNHQRAVKGTQFVDFEFVPGAAVEMSLLQ